MLLLSLRSLPNHKKKARGELAGRRISTGEVTLAHPTPHPYTPPARQCMNKLPRDPQVSQLAQAPLQAHEQDNACGFMPLSLQVVYYIAINTSVLKFKS